MLKVRDFLSNGVAHNFIHVHVAVTPFDQLADHHSLTTVRTLMYSHPFDRLADQHTL